MGGSSGINEALNATRNDNSLRHVEAEVKKILVAARN
jgi:hypothetical protein